MEDMDETELQDELGENHAKTSRKRRVEKGAEDEGKTHPPAPGPGKGLQTLVSRGRSEEGGRLAKTPTGSLTR